MFPICSSPWQTILFPCPPLMTQVRCDLIYNDREIWKNIVLDVHIYVPYKFSRIDLTCAVSEAVKEVWRSISCFEIFF